MSTVSEKLRQLAAEVEIVPIPPQTMSYAEARAMVVAAFGGKGCIQFGDWPTHAKPFEWSIWDGEQHFKAADLREAVNLALASHAAAKAKSPTTEAEVDQAMSEIDMGLSEIPV